MATLNTLVSFDGTDGAASFSGAAPFGGLLLDAEGDLFGTTDDYVVDGMDFPLGTVFEIPKTDGAYASTPTTLFTFNGTDGTNPFGNLILDGAGDLFGTASQGGANMDGTVFKVADTDGTYANSPTTLLSFGVGIPPGGMFPIGNTGENPFAGMIMDGKGDLFGTTNAGGDAGGNGTVFEVLFTGGSYSVNVSLISFNGGNGSAPEGALIMDAAGDLFGTTTGGGANNDGTVFEVAKTTAGGYSLVPITLASFDGTDGKNPGAGLIMDAAGDLFGTTFSGGANNDGAVFEIAKTASGYASTPTVLVSFNGTDGESPESTLVMDAVGDLFGTASLGGANRGGTVFEVAKTGGVYASAPITLVNFNGTNGEISNAGLTVDAAGDLFGTTSFGGANGDGTAFELTDSGFQGTPAREDFAGGGMSDVLLEGGNDQLVDWTISGSQITSGHGLTFQGNAEPLDALWSVAGIGDFDGAGRDDILLQNNDGAFVDWVMNGSQITSGQNLTFQGTPITLPLSWSVAGIGDFDGSGRDDILLQNTDGIFVDWAMNGSQVVSAQELTFQGVPVTLPSSWSVVGIDDFHGTGKDDILLHNTDGAFVDWTMNGSQITSAEPVTDQGNPVTLDSSWSVVGVGHFTGAAQDDILLRNTDGEFVDWAMNGAQITSAESVTNQGNPVMLDASWSVAEIGDFSDSDQDSILLRNTNGSIVEWTLNGSAAITSAQSVTSQGSPAILGNTWQIDGDPATNGGSGSQIVSAGEVVTNPIIGGGALELLAGATVNGVITFAAGSTGSLLDEDQASLPDTVMGFAEGVDSLSFLGESDATIATVVASARLVNGNTVLGFPDGTSIVLNGVTHVDAGIFA